MLRWAQQRGTRWYLRQLWRYQVGLNNLRFVLWGAQQRAGIVSKLKKLLLIFSFFQ